MSMLDDPTSEELMPTMRKVGDIMAPAAPLTLEAVKHEIG
jgi:hypothetical protein